ncbi:MAG TPA: universal stress protein [Longimicrobium sp.]|nr:universal stress protein [Longimicrobium sp.]
MTHPLRTIVAGIATLDGDDPVLATSVHLAGRTGATLHLVHAYRADEAPPGWNVETWRSGTAARSPQARLLESRMQAHADLFGPATQTECIALPGTAGEVLPAYAAAVDADVLVLAPTRRAGAAGAVLGTTASRVLRASSVPVLVLHERLAERAPRRVLLPTDLSEHSARALPLASTLAAALAYPHSPMLFPLYVSPAAADTGAFAFVTSQVEQAEAELDAFLASIPPATLPGTVRVGSPAHVILEVAREWDADLVVLGTHGRRGLPRFFLGSVAETVLRKAHCSALVIPPAAVRSGDAGQDAPAADPVAGRELPAET